MQEIDFTNMVLATVTSGEKVVGTFADRKDFEEDARTGVAVVLKNVRNLSMQETQHQTPEGVVRGLMINLLPLPPFTFPVPELFVRLSSWIYLSDHEELHPHLTKMVTAAETRETQMRATASGITLAGMSNARGS